MDQILKRRAEDSLSVAVEKQAPDVRDETDKENEEADAPDAQLSLMGGATGMAVPEIAPQTARHFRVGRDCGYCETRFRGSGRRK